MVLPAELLPDLKAQLQELLVVYTPERFLKADPANNHLYKSWERNWLDRPPVIVRVAGAEQPSGYTVNYRDGTITFATAPTSIVTAEFYFSPYSDEQLEAFLLRGTRELSSLTGDLIDDTVDLDPRFEVPIQDLAYLRAFENLWSGVASYHMWIIEGQTVDKTDVAKAYMNLAQTKRQAVMEMVKRIRLASLGTGNNVITLNTQGTT